MNSFTKDIQYMFLVVFMFFLLVNCMVYYKICVYQIKTKCFMEAYKAISEIPEDLEVPEQSLICENIKEDKHDDLG